VTHLTRNRPFTYASAVVGVFAFIMLAPVILLTMINLSDHMIFETNDIHFHIIEISEDELLDKIHASLDDLNIEELATVAINDSDKFRTLSIFFKLQTHKEAQINEFIENLKSNSSLLFSRENWKSYMSEGFIKSDYLVVSQLLSLVMFSMFYMSSLMPKVTVMDHNNFKQRVLAKTTATTFILLLLVQVFYMVLNLIGVDFSEIEEFYEKSLGTGWMIYLSMIILAPMVEELVFRGIIFKNFMINKLPIKGALFTSALFASIHQWQIWQASLGVKISHFIMMFVVSMVFCWLYKKTARLWVPIYAHTLYNSTLLLFDYWSKQPG